MDVLLTRFLTLCSARGAWEGVPALYRPLIVAALRRDPARAVARLDQLAELWRAAKEET